MNHLSDFRVYMRVENRPDLFAAALRSIPEFWPLLTVMDNSGSNLACDLIGSLDKNAQCSINISIPFIPLTFTQSHNAFFKEAKNHGCNFILWMHSDAEVIDGGHLKLLEFARKCTAEGRKWGLIWTNYDSLAAVNLAMIDDIGGYDTIFPKYFCDNDHTYRMRLRGWETIDTGIMTKHHGSSTIKSDPKLKLTNNATFDLYRTYYRRKWGGDPEKEIYTSPFNRPELFSDLKPVGVW